MFEGSPRFADTWRELFPAKLTASGITDVPGEGEITFYSWVEQSFDPKYGTFTDAPSPRQGNFTNGPFLREINNIPVKVPNYVWIRFRGIIANLPFYEFTAGNNDFLVAKITSSGAPSTTLTGNITTGDSSFGVASVTNFPVSPNYIVQVDTEYMQVSSVGNTTFSVTRGVKGSVAGNHTNGSNVTLADTYAWTEQIPDTSQYDAWVDKPSGQTGNFTLNQAIELNHNICADGTVVLLYNRDYNGAGCSTLSSNVSNVTTSWPITSRTSFPNAAPFDVQVGEEIARVTGGNGTGAGNFTVTRSMYDTVASNHTIGDVVEQVVREYTFVEQPVGISQNIDIVTNVQCVGGTIVVSSQTLSYYNGDLIAISNATMESAGCCDCPPSSCPCNDTTTCWTLTLSGLTDGSCPCVAELNGQTFTFTPFTPSGNCEWISQTFTFCSNPDSILIITYNSMSNIWSLNFFTDVNNFATYTLAGASYNCTGSNTWVYDSDNGTCGNWPGTLTLNETAC
jgi:hypothetical protein